MMNLKHICLFVFFKEFHWSPKVNVGISAVKQFSIFNIFQQAYEQALN